MCELISGIVMNCEYVAVNVSERGQELTPSEREDFPEETTWIIQDQTNVAFQLDREKLRPYGFSVTVYVRHVRDAAKKLHVFRTQLPRVFSVLCR